MLKLREKLLLNTALLALVLILQLAGLMKGINTKVDSLLPSPSPSLLSVLTAFGGDVFLIAFSLLTVLLDVRNSGKLSRETLVFLVSAVIGLVIVGVLKVAINEPRPRNHGGFSFPSGHTYRGAIIAVYASNRWKRATPLAVLFALGVAMTRLLLHVHWFGDVLFSLLLAPWVYSIVKATQDSWLPLYRRVISRLGLGAFDVE
ncbi:phosphatase PAP2 family protein [Thermococcus nautili]|uniref:Membrane-associated phospholipid phosphatase n=1 Tax=Thermococcus nautili TaxID=195522 RepID=W8NT22_9EURY|nr:phosphatase PAP2 family protein [Thermococcus nautili]AHL22252.1 Membrane-associated phospholipid phosphatase [Thermococcus nautili]